MKLLEDHPNFSQTNWSFLVRSPESIALLYNTIHKTYQVQLMLEAYSSNCCLIEVCNGDYKNPTLIVQTPGVDLQGLQQRWCLDYCKAHGYDISFPKAGEPSREQEGWI